MILSKNAVGNLINRYKAVLGKCRLINTFGSLALAAALTLGGAGLAMAGDGTPTPNEQGYWTDDITIDSEVKVTTFFTEAPEGKNITATSITLGGGGSLTLKNGARLINGVPGTDGDAPGYLDFKMTGGDLTLGGGSYTDDGINASINARSVNISGGTVNIEGKGTTTNWFQAAQIGGYRGLTVSGGTINMNSYSQLFGGGTVGAQFTGGTVNMMGDSAASAVGNSAAHIMFGSTGQNLIADNAHIVVGDAKSSSASYGVMTTGLGVTMSGGALYVNNGELLLQPATNERDAKASLVYTGDATGAFNQTGGAVTIADQGAMTLNTGMTYSLSGGRLSNVGTLNIGTISGTGSKLNLEKTAAFSNIGSINVINGMIHMDGSMGTDLLLHSDEAQVNLGDGGQLLFTRDDGSVVDLTDKLATAATNGKISLASGSSITGIAGITLGDTIFNYSGATLNTNNLQAGKIGQFEVNSGTINANEFSLLGTNGDGATTLAVNSGGTLTLGQFSSGTEAVTLPVGGKIADTLSNAGSTTIAAGDNWSAGTVNNTSGTFKVTGGKLTVGALDVKAGAVFVGSDSGSAGLHIGSSIKSTSAGDGSSTGVNVMNNGVLSGDVKKFVTYTDDVAAIAAGLKKIHVANGGTLRLDGLESVNTQQMQSTKNVLTTGSSGLISYGAAAIEISGVDKGTSDGSITGAAAEATSAVLAGINAEYTSTGDAITVGGDFGADALVVTDNAGDVAATINGNLTLLGNGGQLIIAEGDAATNVSIAAGKNLNLGSTGAPSNGGKLNGNVKLVGAGSALNVAAADYTVGDITAGTADDGNVTVSAGGGLTAGAIGAATKAVSSVSATNGALAATSIDAGTVTADNGDIATTAGITAASLAANNGGSIVAGGDITLTGAANVTSGSIQAENITANSVDLNNGSLAAQSLTVVGADSSFTDGAQVNVGSLDAGGKIITVGDADDTKSTSLVAGSLTLNGGSLLIDPDWAADGPSTVTLLTLGAAQIDGNVGVGQNSLLTIGTLDKGWLAEQVNAVTNGAGLTPGGVTAALGLKKAQVLGTGRSLVVDGSLNTAGLSAKLGTPPPTATFADNSLLVVTAAAASAPAGALSATTPTTADIGDSAKLRITDAKVGQDYTVLGSNMAAAPGAAGTGWTGSNFSTDSRMINGSFNALTGVLSTGLNSAANVYPKLDGDLVKVLDNAYTADQVGPAHVDSDVKGVRFLSRATSDNFIGSDANLAAKTIESAARIAVAGAVPQMTMAANNAAGAAITQRTSIAQPDGNGMQSVSLNKAEGAAKNGMALWIMPLYQSQNAWNMEAGDNYDLKWHGGLGGVALGGDYTFDNALRAGIAFNIGGGYAEGEGDLAKTTNSFSFWGLGLYGGWAVENFGLTADVNYTSTYNKVKQELPGAMQMRDLKSDITAYALSTGLRAEYKLNTQYVDIIPHLGVRYMYVSTDSYDVKSNGTVMRGDEMSQNIWTFPIGVTFSKQVETGNGWYVKPNLDLGIIPATGDIEARSKIRFTGTGTKAELDTHTMDYMSYTGGLGLDFGNDNLSLGVNYNIQASEHSTSHGVFGTVRYEF